MSFKEWVDRRYRRKGESFSAALMRFCAAESVSMPSIYYAYRGARVSPPLAAKIEAATGKAVTLSSLVTGPSREEVKQRGAA
jgi:hypothetical protein